MSRLRLIAAGAIALVLLLPATALAAPYGVTGSVTDAQGNAVAGAEVTILVQGTDTILSTTSAEDGSWAIALDAEPGASIEVNGTGPAVATGPDEDGCTTTTVASGQVQAALPVEGEPEPVALVLDRSLSGTVCATVDVPDTANVTPPSTDTISESGDGAMGGSFALLLGLVGVFSAGTLVVTTVAAPSRRR